MTTTVMIAIAAISLLVLVLGGTALLLSGRRKPTEPAVSDATEAPEVPSGRMVRLRSRLADSLSTLGRGLLAGVPLDQARHCDVANQ